jgi:hypothetical protein
VREGAALRVVVEGSGASGFARVARDAGALAGPAVRDGAERVGIPALPLPLPEGVGASFVDRRKGR